jgi:hypothetical protein
LAVRVGEITVFKLNEREIPIVHRVMNVHERPQLLPSGKPNKVSRRACVSAND